ncbi:MAG TPA: hypothetical protein VMH35_11455 [Streptosporangiaceae bacterium]|nr:hypothetical protein [Streptosporangiaceae bacterium]
MHPYIQQTLIDTRIAEIRSEVEHHRLARRAHSATQRSGAQPIDGPGSLLHHVLSALLTTCGQRRRPGRLGAPAPQDLRA